MEEEVVRFATAADPLLACSMCRSLLREAVQLTCLHNCCRHCFSTAASKDAVSCRLCGTATQVGSEKPNVFVDDQVRHYMTISESRSCGKCRENGDPDKPALVWCPVCRHSLGGDCIAAHRQYFRQHVTQSFEDLNSLDELRSKQSAAVCTVHDKPLDIACLNCEEAKCTSCWATCKEKKHEVHIVTDKSFESYVVNLAAGISAIERELLLKAAVLEKPKNFLGDTKAARDRHLEELNTRKRRVVEAVETTYQNMTLATKDAYDVLEAEGEAAAEAAERIASDLSDARSYIDRLIKSNEKREIFVQQRVVRKRLNVLSTELDNLHDRLTSTTREVKIDASLPDNIEDVVREWIGMPRMYSASTSTAPPAQQLQSFSFGDASASFKLPVHCRDVALTKDGRSLLLAAEQHGLIELSSSCGHELSRWRPPKHNLSSSSSSSQDDEVQAVAALSDGRAAVSLLYAQLVVLLRRSEKGGSSTDAAAAAGDDAWTEDSRMEQLPWPAGCLSAHGDVLAASEGRLNEQTNKWQPGSGRLSEFRVNLWLPGPRLQLLSLSSRRRLSAELQREYGIFSLAVAARVIVTGSYGKVELGGSNRAAYVLDAHSLTDDGSDERLWRHVLSSSDNNEEEEEQLYGICIDSGGGCLYAAVWRSDESSSRVSALSLADGSELRCVTLSFSPAAAAAAATQPQQLLLPWRLSLSDDGAASAAAAEQQQQHQQQLQQQQQHQQQQSRGRRTLLLAALCWDRTTKECRTVTLHSSNSDKLP